LWEQHKDEDNNWVNFSNVILLPQNVETRQITYDGGNFDVNFYYLRQFFSNDVAVTTYLSRIENDVKEVANTTYDLMSNGFNGRTLNMVLQYPGSQMPITDYHHKFEVGWLGAFGYSSIFENMPTINIKSGLPNNLLATTLAHEMFHWIIRENSELLKYDPQLARQLDWLDEGLSVMAQALVFPDYEISSSSSLFMQFSNGFLSEEHNITGFGVNVYDVSGKLIDRLVSYNPYNLSFSLSNYNPAEYLVEINIANQTLSKKIVKQ